MIVRRHSAVAISALALFLNGCRPYGCDSDQCVKEAPYARSKHCYSVYQAGVHMVGDPRSRTSIRGDVSALRDRAMQEMSFAIDQGRVLGLASEAIYRELERERATYLRPFTSGVPTPAQYDMLVENLARCHDAEDL